MFKYLLLFLMLTALSESSARTGWSFSHYSLFAGQEYRSSQIPLLNVEFRYDRFGSSCLKYNHYHGVGFNFSFNSTGSEYGLTGILNPTRMLLKLNRRTKFYPYLYGKAAFRHFNYSADQSMLTKYADEYFLQPGIGFTGNLREDTTVPIKLLVQVGYQTPFHNKAAYGELWIANIGIGIGLDFQRLRKTKPNPPETKDN